MLVLGRRGIVPKGRRGIVLKSRCGIVLKGRRGIVQSQLLVLGLRPEFDKKVNA